MKAVIILYYGSELNEYSMTRIASTVNEHCTTGSNPQIMLLNDRDISRCMVKNCITETTKKVDTSVGDAALIYVAEKFKSVWNDKTQLLIQMSRAVGQNKDVNLIKNLHILNDPSHPYQKEIGRDYHYGEMQKYCVETVYNAM